MTLTVVAEKKGSSDKRRRIIDAAVSVFSRQGFYTSTVADVAAEADVADGTIYLYFKNKDDLLISIFEECMDIFIAAAEEELTNGKSAIEKLKRFVALHLKLVQKNRELAQVIQIELRQSSKFMKEYANEKFFAYLSVLEKILSEGIRSGEFSSAADPVILKRAIFGAIDEMALEWVLMKRKRYTMEEAAEQLGRLFVEGLGVKT